MPNGVAAVVAWVVVPAALTVRWWVLSLLAVVKREDFVPPAYRALAFVDTEVPLPGGQSMLAPKVEARLLQELDVKKHERVLEVGTGSGYVAALLAHKAQQVITMDLAKPPYGFQALGGTAVIADNSWAALQGRKNLKVEWNPGEHASYDSAAYKNELLATVRKPGRVAREILPAVRAALGAARAGYARRPPDGWKPAYSFVRKGCLASGLHLSVVTATRQY